MFDHNTETGEIWLYDTIGPAWAGMIDSESVIKVLQAMGGKPVTLRVSSPGGSVWDAVEMHNAIANYTGQIVAQVDAIAGSAASFLILAADEVVAASNSTLMIHQAMTATFGNAVDHAKSIEMLDVVDANIIGMYRKKTTKTDEEIKAAMAAETWFTAEQALEWGLVDRIGDATDVQAKVPAGMFNKTPKHLLASAEPGTRTPYPVHRERARVMAKSYQKNAC